MELKKRAIQLDMILENQDDQNTVTLYGGGITANFGSKRNDVTPPSSIPDIISPLANSYQYSGG